MDSQFHALTPQEMRERMAASKTSVPLPAELTKAPIPKETEK